MDRESETRVGRRFDAAFARIRSKVCRMGMAATWHVGKAADIAERTQGESDDSVLPGAVAGLRRAAEHYDHKRGYRFAEYAQHWIREAIEKRLG